MVNVSQHALRWKQVWHVDGVWLKHSSWRGGQHLTTTCLYCSKFWEVLHQHFHKSSRTENSFQTHPSRSASAGALAPQARAMDLYSWWTVLGWKTQDTRIIKTESNIACLCKQLYTCNVRVHSPEKRRITNIIYVGLSGHHVHFFVCEFLTQVRFHEAQHINTDETIYIRCVPAEWSVQLPHISSITDSSVGTSPWTLRLSTSKHGLSLVFQSSCSFHIVNGITRFDIDQPIPGAHRQRALSTDFRNAFSLPIPLTLWSDSRPLAFRGPRLDRSCSFSTVQYFSSFPSPQLLRLPEILVCHHVRCWSRYHDWSTHTCTPAFDAVNTCCQLGSRAPPDSTKRDRSTRSSWSRLAFITI